MARGSTRPTSIIRHSTLALVLLSVATTLLQQQPRGDSTLEGNTAQSHATIAVEHTEPFTLQLILGNGRKPTLVDLSHDGSEIAHISVPLEWTLREVRGASLEALNQEPPAAGFIRLAFPPTATLSFLLPQTPSSLVLRNIPPSPHMSLHWQRIDLATGRMDEDVKLISGREGRVW